MLRTTDTLFFCTKGGWQVDDENGAINSITSLFYHKLLTDHRQIIAPKKDKNIGNIRSECVDQVYDFFFSMFLIIFC